MSETFLILLSAGVLLSAAISNPRDVTLNWLRLAGILALCFAGLSVYFVTTAQTDLPIEFRRDEQKLIAVTIIAILAQLAFAQTGRRQLQRASATVGAIAGMITAVVITHNFIVLKPDSLLLFILRTLALIGIAACAGLALMDMLLGHAYLTASKMTIHPFQRLNNSLAIAIIARFLLAIAACFLVHVVNSGYMFWNIWGLYIGTRFLVGLIVPAVFVYMARDCINRRSTQSATGILYVTAVLIFIGEIISLYLIRETYLPF